MTTFLQYQSENPTGTFASYCRDNIFRMCKEVAPDSITVDEIKKQFMRMDPKNPAWKEKARGSRGNDKKYRHTIGMELDNLTNTELSNWKNKHYRFLSDEDRTRVHLDPYQVWMEVLRNARSEALDNNHCLSPKGEKKYTFVLDRNDQPYVYTQTKTDKSPILRRAVNKIVKSINVEPEGRVQSGWRPEALRSAIVHCCDDLKFDGHGWITLSKTKHQNRDDDENTIIDELNDSPPPSDIRGLVKRTKRKAKGGSSTSQRRLRKIPHDIDDEEWIIEKEKLTHCEVTGIAFTDFRGPFQRSLDQRIPGMGYTKENTDVVILMYNYAKLDYEAEEVLEFCKQFVANKG